MFGANGELENDANLYETVALHKSQVTSNGNFRFRQVLVIRRECGG